MQIEQCQFIRQWCRRFLRKLAKRAFRIMLETFLRIARQIVEAAWNARDQPFLVGQMLRQ